MQSQASARWLGLPMGPEMREGCAIPVSSAGRGKGTGGEGKSGERRGGEDGKGGAEESGEEEEEEEDGGGGGGRKEGGGGEAVLASKNKNPTLRVWGGTLFEILEV